MRGPPVKRSPFAAGSHIFLFRHTRTNQVLYSLHHFLDGRNEKSMHKQLPFLGKKTKPAEIRPDLWLPYARVDFHPAETWKGLLAYRKLREYQTLRYYSWRQKGDPGLHKSRPELLESIQDQSRTSVADLANVLTQSENWDVEKKQRREKVIQNRREQLEESWRRTVKKVRAGRQGLLAEAEDRVNKANNPKDLIQARTEVNKYKRAGEAVAAVKGGLVDEAARERWNEELKEMVEYKTTGKIEGYTLEETAPNQASRPETEASTSVAEETADSASEHPIAQVMIRWADLRDAEWARSWPSLVQHDQIGYTTRDLPFGSRRGSPVTDAIKRQLGESAMSQWSVYTKNDGEVLMPKKSKRGKWFIEDDSTLDVASAIADLRV